MAPRSGTYEMADRLSGGKLADILRERRDADESFAAIARSLYAEFGITVSVQTISNWLADLEDKAAAS